jgi:hypothetical protein
MVNPAHKDLCLWVQGLEHDELVRLMKAGSEGDIREHKGAMRAYHKMLVFLITDSAGKGKDVIEDAD